MPKYIRSLSFFLLPSLFIFILGFCWFGIFGLLAAMVIMVASFFYCYFYCSDVILSAHQAAVVDHHNSQGLLAIVDHLASKLRLPVPQVYIVSDASPFAFSTGRDIYNASVVVSRGLLNLLTYSELEAIIAHELVRIRRGEPLASCISAALLLKILNPVLEKPGPEGRRLKPDIGILKSFYGLIMAPVAVFFLRLGAAHQRSFKNDSEAAALCNHPETLAYALQKIHRNLTRGPVALRLAVSHLYVVNPITDHPWLSWVKNQPTAADRVQRLLEDCYGRTKR